MEHPSAQGFALRPGSIIERGELWILTLSRTQNLLGKTMLVAARSVERVTELTPAARVDLRIQLQRGNGGTGAGPPA